MDSQSTNPKLAKLYSQKTATRHNTLVPGQEEPAGEDFQHSNETQDGYQEYARSSYSSGQDWAKVKKGEKDSFGSLLGKLGSSLKHLSLSKLVPIGIGLGVLAGGFVLVRNVTLPIGTGEASNLSDAALEIVRAEEREALLEEQRDEVVSESMQFMSRATSRFEEAPAGDVPLIDNANEITATREQIRNNMNLYTTIYLHQELIEHHIERMEEAGVENDDLKATMYSLFELEKRAYDNVREIESMLNELDSLYDSDRGRKLELRAVANEQIVQLNQTHAELQVMIERLDRFFVD